MNSPSGEASFWKFFVAFIPSKKSFYLSFVSDDCWFMNKKDAGFWISEKYISPELINKVQTIKIYGWAAPNPSKLLMKTNSIFNTLLSLAAWYLPDTQLMMIWIFEIANCKWKPHLYNKSEMNIFESEAPPQELFKHLIFFWYIHPVWYRIALHSFFNKEFFVIHLCGQEI